MPKKYPLFLILPLFAAVAAYANTAETNAGGNPQELKTPAAETLWGTYVRYRVGGAPAPIPPAEMKLFEQKDDCVKFVEECNENDFRCVGDGRAHWASCNQVTLWE